MSEIRINEELRKGDEARRMLENPVYVEAVGSVRKGLIDTMGASALGDKETHHRLVIALQLLNQIERSIQRTAETGKLAQIEVEQGMGAKVRGLFSSR